MEKEERKLWVMTWNKSQLEEIKADKNRDFLMEALELAAGKIGMFAISNPDKSIQWVGNKLTENEEAETVSLYVEVFIRHEGAEEYLKRNPIKEEEQDD